MEIEVSKASKQNDEKTRYPPVLPIKRGFSSRGKVFEKCEIHNEWNSYYSII